MSKFNPTPTRQIPQRKLAVFPGLRKTAKPMAKNGNASTKTRLPKATPKV
jgi:hypothetical protein